MWKDILSWMSDNAGLVFTVTILVLCFGTVLGVAAYDRRASIKAYWAHRRSIRVQRGLVMGRKKNSERQAYIKGRWCDGITDFGEKEFLEGRQTREEVNAFYRAIGKTHKMPDLLPYLSADQVKAAIKGRRSRGTNTVAQETPAWGPAPGDPAGEKPTEVKDGNVIEAAKRFGAKALAKIKKTA